MSDTVSIEEIRGQVDFAVLTIRDDEFRAVLDRFKPTRTVLGGKLIYEFATLTNQHGDEITVVISRTIDQGHGAAQTHAHSIIDDLSPSWLVLAGIAGGCPDQEFTLGDVLLASRLVDFSVTAAIQDEGLEFRTTGGPMHRDVEPSRVATCKRGHTWRVELQRIAQHKEATDKTAQFHGRCELVWSDQLPKESA